MTVLIFLPDAGVVCAQITDDSGYIVKYRDSVPQLMDDSSACPFDVVDGKTLRQLRSEDAIEWYEPDFEVELFDEAEEETEELSGSMSPYYSDDMWHLNMIGADLAFRLGCEGQGVRVGVVDSGIAPHPALAGHLAHGYN